MKYTAEEVRKSADWLYQWERKAGVRNARAMLTAYADLLERIEADERAVAIWQYRHTSDAQWLDCDELDADAWKQTGLHEVRKLFTHPPAQAEPTEAVISKAVEVFLNAAPEWNDYLVKDGMRAALIAVWPNPPAQAAQSVDVKKVRRVAADIRHWNEAICHPALNVFADELEAALQEKGNG